MEMMTAASSLTMKFCFRDRSPRDRKNWDYKDKIRDKDVSNSLKTSSTNVKVFTIICFREETIIEEEEEEEVTTILLLLVTGQSR